MRIDILTLFPEMCDTVMKESIIGRAVKKGIIELNNFDNILKSKISKAKKKERERPISKKRKKENKEEKGRRCVASG